MAAMHDRIGEAEVQGKSLYGKGSNRHKKDPVKEGLDPVHLNAVIGMYYFHCED